jgi:hypothetical protein
MIYLIHFLETEKFEILISKLETISNDQNFQFKNTKKIN